LSVGAEELITSEKRGKPLHRTMGHSRALNSNGCASVILIGGRSPAAA
jgi:hypothetical protein